MPRGVRASGPESGNAPSSVQKACLILRAMSDARNVRLTDIAQAAGQDKATTLRLLEVLTRHGFVNRDAESKRYSLGPEIFTLGAAAMAYMAENKDRNDRIASMAITWVTTPLTNAEAQAEDGQGGVRELPLEQGGIGLAPYIKAELLKIQEGKGQ